MSEVPVTHIFYCAWLKTQVETCITGTLDMSQAPLRHEWKPGLKLDMEIRTSLIAAGHKVIHKLCAV